MSKNQEFCIECRKNTAYTLEKKMMSETIRDKDYEFEVLAAICSECGSEMSVPGLLDYNIKEMDRQYREIEGIVRTEDIERLGNLYGLGKAPLSLILGFGEITITRYLQGQVPSKEYSDIIWKALTRPEYMGELLERNKDRITDVAYGRAMRNVDNLKKAFSLSEELLCVIAEIFERCEEVTPLALQKIIYYIQGLSYSVNDRPIFKEDCQAWVHGPVYPEVYELFKAFKYNPIEDDRFIILKGARNCLDNQDMEIIALACETFGKYSAKTLEKITHVERPWLDTRDEAPEFMRSNEIMSKDSIREYFLNLNRQYDMNTASGINEYMFDMFNMAEGY